MMKLSSKVNVSTLKVVRPRRVLRRGSIRTMAMFGGGEGGMGNMMENMKKAQQMVKNEAEAVQQQLAQTEFDGYDEEETVKVTFRGNQEPMSVELTDEAINAGKDILEKRITEAMHDAHGKSLTGMREKMGEMAKKLGLPENMSL